MKYPCCGCLLLCLLVCGSLHSQYYLSANNQPVPDWLWEAGAGAGAMNCLTDIGGKTGAGKKFVKDINWNQTRFCAALFAGLNWQSKLGLRLQVGVGQVSGHDNTLQQVQGIAQQRYRRNLHFRSTVLEAVVLAELHVLPVLASQVYFPRLSPYLTVGAGIFYYNPQAQYNNSWIDLRALHTEGQGFPEYAARRPYKKTSACMPLGAGIKLDAGENLVLRMECLYRITATDYLDDVSNRYIEPALFSKYLSTTTASMAATMADRSTELPGGQPRKNNDIRGNPTNKDAYFSCMVTIGLVLSQLRRK